MKRRTLVSDQRPFIRIIRNSNHFDMTNRHKNNNSLFSNCNIFSCKTHNKRLAHTITVTVCKASSATMRNSIFECQNTNKQTNNHVHSNNIHWTVTKRSACFNHIFRSTNNNYYIKNLLQAPKFAEIWEIACACLFFVHMICD